MIALRGLLAIWITSSYGVASHLGPENCTATLVIDHPVSETPVTLYTPSGTVCLKCSLRLLNSSSDAIFQIGNSLVDSSEGRVVNDTLVVFDSEALFSVSTPVRCYIDATQRYEAQVQHRVLRAPVIIGKTRVSEGDALELICDAYNSRPLPSVQWFSPSGVIISNSQLLRISNITRSSVGNYSCIAIQYNFNATISSSVDVLIQYPPEVLIQSTTPMFVLEGETVQLSCSYQGFPPPDKATWSHNNIQLNGAVGSVDINTDNGSTNLTMLSVVRSDAGLYVCTVYNDEGLGAETVEVQIQYMVVSGPAPDEIIYSGELVILQCHLYIATPQVTYTWTRQDGSQLPDTSFSDNSGTIYIPNVQEVDGGTYICSSGGQLSGNITLNIVNETETETEEKGGLEIYSWIYIGMAVIILLILTPILLCLLLKIVLTKKKSSETKKELPVYEDVEYPRYPRFLKHTNNVCTSGNEKEVKEDPCDISYNVAYGTPIEIGSLRTIP